ncbi:UbiA-like polyprenyltransferase [Desulfomonile tiedjei]|uniref:4-hydroxybenzoate polyprenyltransferase n=1 Tax=Desulfomonile tiedjei (strain ATCC 49306 / DSM 6799 / DCB-1) TaxID=706587 RepID=I4C0H3_DESTA|nr:UbiA-like polyprenyltransferase [Desulfomonile tiedjei]AFM23064.1 4-hydroxybenzoate polyprenyltransferase [Desulfomonile tiedjei DSM 6799]
MERPRFVIRLSSVRVFLEMIKFEHTVFALPFAYTGMFLAARGLPDWKVVLWITVALAAARTLAMTVNRIADKEYDARNPRTSGRALPLGLVDLKTTIIAAFISFMVFEFAAWKLNYFVLILSLPALVFLLGYHYTKRFTWACHWVLGFTDGIAVAGGWAAIKGTIDWPAYVLWFAVTCWIAGVDIIYACQDIDVDRKEGLHSIPSRFGASIALQIARINHILAVAALSFAGLIMDLAWPYWFGVILTSILLIYENVLVSADDLSRLDYAFFNINGYISMCLLAGTIWAIFI